MTQLENVTRKIQALVQKTGYIYALLMTIIRDCFFDFNNSEKFAVRDKLITEELMTLLGFWLQKPDSWFSYPNSFEELYTMMEDADKLMKEMHDAAYESVFSELSKMNQEGSETHIVGLSEDAHAQEIQEAIYYNGDLAFDYEYLYFLPRKYKYDAEWLKQNYCFDPEEVGKIALKIKEILQKKVSSVLCFPNTSIDFKQMGFETEEAFKMNLEFAKYYKIIPSFDENSNIEEITSSIHSFCNSLLDLFTINDTELKDFLCANALLKNFSLELGKNRNEKYHRFGDYNILQEKPIIRLSERSYLIPLVYPVFTSLYETPFYWIMEDTHYRKTAGNHRGTAGEDMVYELLEPIFGEEHIFRDLEIKNSKHHTITDIDTLCVLGSKAICFQVKSKKLSQASRTGSLEQLTNDFKFAVQDAYEQGLICRNYILNQRNVFFVSRNNHDIVNISDTIDEVYIVCLTSENYPALIHQVHELLRIKGNDPSPLVFSVFDLKLITHYLNDPYKFTYYIRQRIKTSSYFISNTEVNLLSFHLFHNLFPDPKYSREIIDDNYAYEINKVYYSYLSGRLSSFNEESLNHSRENKNFDLLCKSIAQINSPTTVDILFFLYDLSSDSREKLIEAINYVKQRSQKNNTVVSVCIKYNGLDEVTGITCVSVQSYASLYQNMFCVGEMHKYHHKASKWLTLGVYNTTKSMVDMAVYFDKEWKEDPVMEKLCRNKIYQGIRNFVDQQIVNNPN